MTSNTNAEGILQHAVDQLVIERNELRAEVEQLTHRAAYAERVWKALGASREQLQAEVERLRAALEKHHDLLSDEPGDYCKTCELDYLARHKE